MSLSQVFNVSISRQTATVSQAGFGTALILGPNKIASGVGTYNSLADVLAEPGITIGSDEGIAAAKYFGQTPKPPVLKIGKRLANVAQVETITPTPVNTTHYIDTINGVAYDYTSDGSATAGEIVAGLTALINADVNSPVTASGVNTLILTANVAGVPFTLSVNANQAIVHTTANVGAAESLAALSLLDDDWYALIMVSHSVGDVLLSAAPYIEALPKLFGTSSNDAQIKAQGSTTDVAYKLKAGSYFRTWIMYSGTSAQFPEAAVFGRFLPYTPGSEQWSFKTCNGVTVDNLSPTDITALKGKNCNFYSVLAGNNVSQEGKVSGGEWIDVIRLIDSITSDMMVQIFGDLLRLPKIPYTNKGISLIEGDVQAVLKRNQKTGGIAEDSVDSFGVLIPGYVTSFPRVSDISQNDRSARKLTGGTFSAILAGAIIGGSLNGTVTT